MLPRIIISAAISVGAVPAAAQTAIDRVDPARIERDNLPKPAKSEEIAPVVLRPAAPPPTTTSGVVAVGAITFTGLAGLSAADFSDIVTRYIGRSLSSSDLAALTDEIAARARGRGYVFASASIDPQRMTAGVLTVRYDPGTLDDIRLVGEEHAGVRDALAPLIGRPAQMDQVERRLLLAGDIDGVSIRKSQFVRENGRGILMVTVVHKHVRVRAVAENDSTAPIGPEQLRLDVDLNGLFGTDDAFTVTYVTTPFEPDELQFGRARYTKRVGRDGTELTATAAISSTHPGAYLADRDINGRSISGSIGVRQPLMRRREASLWFSGELDIRDSRSMRGETMRRHDRIVAMRVSLYGTRRTAGGNLRGNLVLSRGLDLFGATRAGDPLASRDDGDGVFTHLAGFVDWTRPLGDGLSLRLAARGQLSSDPLLIAEEIGIGGSAFLRGYDYSERSGDQGYMGLGELRYDWRNPLGLGRKAQLYAFLDGGRLTNLDDGFGGGSLASSGGGVRADVSPTIDANVELAFPLTGPRFETGDRDPRFNVRLLKLF